MKWLIILLLGFLLGSMWRIDLSSCNGTPSQDEELYKLLEASRDSLKTYRKLNGEEIARRQAYAATNSRLLGDLAKRDKQIAEFNKVIKRFKDPVAVIDHRVTLDYKGKGEVRIIKEKGEIQFPIIAQKDDKHIFARVEVNEEESDWQITTRANFAYAVESKRKGFLGIKGKEYHVKAITDNPYISTIGLNGFTETVKPSRIHVGFYAGMGINLQPNVGLGVMYSLFEL